MEVNRSSSVVCRGSGQPGLTVMPSRLCSHCLGAELKHESPAGSPRPCSQHCLAKNYLVTCILEDITIPYGSRGGGTDRHCCRGFTPHFEGRKELVILTPGRHHQNPTGSWPSRLMLILQTPTLISYIAICLNQLD